MTNTSDAPRAADAQRWDAPALDGASDSGFLTAKRLQELQKQAHDEAYAEGLEAGKAAGGREVERRVARLDKLLQAMAQPFEELDDTVEEQLADLAMMVAKQLFRREIKLEPTHVIGVVREAVHLLPAASREIVVHLHPDDAALVRDSLSSAQGERAWSIVEDPLVNRGGCTVTTANSQIDAQADTRLQAAIAAILGDERSA